MTNFSSYHFATVLLLSTLLLVQSQCPSVLRKKHHYNEASQDLLCEKSCTIRTSYAGISFGSFTNTYYVCCEGEAEPFGRLYSCPATNSKPGQPSTQPPPTSQPSVSQPPAPPSSTSPPAEPSASPTPFPASPSSSPDTSEGGKDGVNKSCPERHTSNKNRIISQDNVCEFECTIGVGLYGFSTGTITRKVFSCCEGYQFTEVRRRLYNCLKEE